jgi:hypothetical protein
MYTPTAFVQTYISEQESKIMMKIRGLLVDIRLELYPGYYKDYIVIERNQTILYVQMFNVLYGVLLSPILFYNKFRKDIESIGFEVNLYDICVVNQMVNDKKQAVLWHVGDIKASHMNNKVNEKSYK